MSKIATMPERTKIHIKRQNRAGLHVQMDFRGIMLLLLAGLLVSTLWSPSAQAARRNYSSYITPFTNNQNYQFHVFGDGLASGLSTSLAKDFTKEGNIDVINNSAQNAGLSREYRGNLTKQVTSVLAGKVVHVAIILIGSNDAGGIFYKRRKYPVSDEQIEWKKIYEERILKLTRTLQKKNAAVYWVGLPIMREKGFNETLQLLNDTYREMAYRSNIKFIDTWNGFTDQYGQYTPYAADVDGQIKRLRLKNGVGFTVEGFRKLAHYVQREIRRDLALAREERNIPLAGDEEEQRTTMAKTRDRKVARKNRSVQRKTAIPTFETKTIAEKSEPVNNKGRRAIADSYGGIVAIDINNGLTALVSISTLNTLGTVNRKNSQSLLPLAKRPYYRVLDKGEVLPPKPDRADDFTWSVTH